MLQDLRQTLETQGPESAIEALLERLRASKDYGNLFYALLLKARVGMGASPVPTESSQSMPDSMHEPYEEAIRQAGRAVGELYLADGRLPEAWSYFRMIGEQEPIKAALERLTPGPDDDVGPLIEIALNQNLLPRKGFDWLLERHGICSAITFVSGHEISDAIVREYCIRRLVRAMYEQVHFRLSEEIKAREGSEQASAPLRQLMIGRDWLFEEGFYHVDASHLSSVVQLSLQLSGGAEIDLARQLCDYGERLPEMFQFRSDPPFEKPYQDMGIYLAVVAGENVEEGLAHFRAKVEALDLENDSMFPAEIFVGLLVKAGRPKEAADISRRYLQRLSGMPLSCPSLVELCRLADDRSAMIQAAEDGNDPVHYLAGLIADQAACQKRKSR